MNKILTIAGRELKNYFQSPIAYIVLGITIAIFNVFFYLIIEQSQEATLRDMFKLMEFLFVFIVPLLTMKVFAEEKSTGTIEFLLTTPTSPGQIVWGKYLGSLGFFTLILAVTVVYYGILEYFANPDRLPVVVGYAVLWLEGALFIAIGIFTSSLTRSQIVAAIVSYLIIFTSYFSVGVLKYAAKPWDTILRFIGVINHTENAVVGIFAPADVVFFLSGIIFFVFLTRLNVGPQK